MISSRSLPLAHAARQRRLSVSTQRALWEIALRSGDLAAGVAAAGLAAVAHPPAEGTPAAALVALAAVFAAQAWTRLGVYQPPRTKRVIPAFRLGLGWAVALLAVAGFALAAGVGVATDDLRWILASLVAGVPLLVAARWGFASVRAHADATHAMARRVALIGCGEPLAAASARLREVPEEVALVALVDLGGASFLPGTAAPQLADLQQRVAAGSVDRLLLAFPEAEAELFERTVAAVEHLPVDIDWVPQLPIRHRLPHRPGAMRSLPCLPLRRRPIDGMGLIAKEIGDRVIAGLALLFLAPLLLLLALAVKLSSKGPVFYRQLRRGFNQEIISVIKFRTMHAESCDSPGSNAFRQATRGDTRVTPLGRLLRRTSLDELPQLLNVLKGEMSLVGPRPHPLALDDRYVDRIDGYLARHRVKPGITGWAQVNGCRGETADDAAMAQRIAYDLEYIENWSLFFDLRVLWLTLFRGFVHENAY